MMQVSYELMRPLIEARQAELRKEAWVEVSRPGRLRTLAGLLLVRLGEQVAGVQRSRPAPATPARLAVR